MLRTTRSRYLVAAAVGVAAAAIPASAFAGAGTGSVTTTVAATALPGALTLTGVGVSVTPSQTPGVFSSSAVGTTSLNVADLTGSTNGWAVTATYTDPSAALQATGQKPIGGSNVEVSSSGVLGDASAAASPSVVTDQPLTTPVTVLSTGASGGSGVTTASSDLKVRIPATAQATEVYGGTVTYTVASVR